MWIEFFSGVRVRHSVSTINSQSIDETIAIPYLASLYDPARWSRMFRLISFSCVCVCVYFDLNERRQIKKNFSLLLNSSSSRVFHHHHDHDRYRIPHTPHRTKPNGSEPNRTEQNINNRGNMSIYDICSSARFHHNHNQCEYYLHTWKVTHFTSWCLLIHDSIWFIRFRALLCLFDWMRLPSPS